MPDDAPLVFDPDAWGASPNGEPEPDRSVYDDDELDDELVPSARSLVPADAGADWLPNWLAS
jgi:hypothetical protein